MSVPSVLIPLMFGEITSLRAPSCCGLLKIHIKLCLHCALYNTDQSITLALILASMGAWIMDGEVF